MESSAFPRRKKRGLLLLLVAAVLIVAAVVLVVASPSLVGQKSSPVELTAAPQYLQYLNSSSGIYLVSATANSGAFPLSDVIPPHPDNVEPTPTPIMRAGESCIIVNATLRSDYTVSNPSPNQFITFLDNGTGDQTPSDNAYVFLTAKLYDKAGQEISAIDVTPPYGYPNGGADLLLHNGETDSITIYLSTARTDIDHFTVEARYIGALPLP
jgi:hypothetical protein